MPSLPSQILPFLPQAARKPLVSLVLPYPPFRPPLPLTTNTYQYLPVLAPVSNPSHTLTQYTVKLMVTATLWYTTLRRWWMMMRIMLRVVVVTRQCDDGWYQYRFNVPLQPRIHPTSERRRRRQSTQSGFVRHDLYTYSHSHIWLSYGDEKEGLGPRQCPSRP